MTDQHSPTAVGSRDLDPARRDAFLSALWGDLHRLAGSLMIRERPNHTLGPTGLVNEAMLYLLSREELLVENPGNRVLLLAAVVMRHILTDHARQRNAIKRGCGYRRLDLTAVRTPTESHHDYDLVELHDLLETLSRVNQRAGAIVALRLLGKTLPEIAESLAVSLSTVESGWRFARSWLRRELSGVSHST